MFRQNTRLSGRITAASFLMGPEARSFSFRKSASASIDSTVPPDTTLSGSSSATAFFTLPPERVTTFTWDSPISNDVMLLGMEIPPVKSL